jgi:signal peptidase I
MLKEKYTALKEKLKWLDPFTYVEILLRKYHPKKEYPVFQDEAIDSIVYVVSALVFAFLLYSILGFLLNTSSPMVIVSSASMIPEMYRGDIIVLYGEKNIKAEEVNFSGAIKGKMYFEFGKTVPDPLEKYIDPITGKIVFQITDAKELQIGSEKIPVTKDGDTIVYFSPYSGKEIIHRAVAKINAVDGTFFLTKGDANPSIDQECVPYENFGETVYLACITKNPVPENEIRGKAIFRIPLLGCAKLWVFDDIPSILSGKPNLDFSGIC